MARKLVNTRDIVAPGYPLLRANRSVIESVSCTTHTYGATESHKLNVYVAPSTSQEPVSLKPPLPVLVFFYGGSFIRGSRRLETAPNFVYANVGAFFALRAFVTVIADYRLVPGITFPQGSEDVRDALLWVRRNVREGDTDHIFVLAHSAGGIHLETLLLTPSLYLPELRTAVSGVVLLGVPFEIKNGKRAEIWEAALIYYGSSRDIALLQPYGLLQHAQVEYIAALPPLRVAIAGSEPRTVRRSGQRFAELYAQKRGPVEVVVLDGHDHVSPLFALSSVVARIGLKTS